MEEFSFCVALLAALGGVFSFCYVYFIKPLRLLAKLKGQGVKGCPFRPFLGQVPESLKIIRDERERPASKKSALAFFDVMAEKYGDIYYYCLGPTAKLVLTDPALIRQAYVNNNDCYHKTAFVKAFRILGNGLVTASGDLWARQRRRINPAFNHKELKRMYHTMLQCSVEALKRWDQQLDEGNVEFDMSRELGSLALNIIGKTAFGADLGGASEEAEATLLAFQSYFENVARWFLGPGLIPLYRHFPTRQKRMMKEDENQIKAFIMSVIKTRRLAREQRRFLGTGVAEVDLLELMLSATDASSDDTDPTSHVNSGSLMSDKQLMDECVTFLGAGHETTTNLLVWTMLLLSEHLEWQERIRLEVLEICGYNDPPSYEQLSQLKSVGMVLYESLRLYPPAAIIGRTCVQTTKLGDLEVPKGIDIVIPIAYIHRKLELWGKDADKFQPERFANGISKACSHPMAFLPFSVGPRTCIGQNFALTQGKLILSLLLQRYTWKTAPGYRHCPELTLTLSPKYGMPMILKKISG